MLTPASIDKSSCIPAGIMSPGLGPAELLRNCLLDWAPSGANKKRPPGLGPGSFPKKLQWGPVFLCQIENGGCARVRDELEPAATGHDCAVHHHQREDEPDGVHPEQVRGVHLGVHLGVPREYYWSTAAGPSPRTSGSRCWWAARTLGASCSTTKPLSKYWRRRSDF